MNESEIFQLLEQYDIHPNERLGQHILIDSLWLNYLASQADPDAHVIEIGAGPGNLTERIATVAKSVTAIELDRRYEPMLVDLQRQHSNITVIFGDALNLNFRQIHKKSDLTLQVIANIPYHISEPLMKKFTKLPIENAVITVGDKLSVTLRVTNPSSIDFTKLSLLALGFFEIDFLAEIPKSAFYPVPRTESHIIRITPKMKAELSNPGVRVIQQLFINGENSSVENIIRAALQGGVFDQRIRDKDERNRHERRETRKSLEVMRRGYIASRDLSQENRQGVMDRDPLLLMYIPEQIRKSRFSKLNNDELSILTRAIFEAYS